MEQGKKEREKGGNTQQGKRWEKGGMHARGKQKGGKGKGNEMKVRREVILTKA